MRRPWTYMLAGSIVAIGTAAHAGGLPASDEDSASNASSTTQTESTSTDNTAATATATSTSGATASSESTATSASASADQADSENNTNTDTTQTADAGGVAQDQVNTGSFVAIEDDPLIIDASSVVDGDGVGSMQVQWQISENGTAWSNLSGEIRQSFTPRELHVGRQLLSLIHI